MSSKLESLECLLSDLREQAKVYRAAGQGWGNNLNRTLSRISDLESRIARLRELRKGRVGHDRRAR
jgi:RNA processing factor Prp31